MPRAILTEIGELYIVSFFIPGAGWAIAQIGLVKMELYGFLENFADTFILSI